MITVKAINVEKSRKAWGEYVQRQHVAWIIIDGGDEEKVAIPEGIYWAMRDQLSDSDFQEVDYIAFTPALQWHMSEPDQPYRFSREGEL